MGKIVVIGLGHADVSKMTVEALEKMTNGNIIVLRTERHKVIDYLDENNIKYSSYDYVYEEHDSFDDVYRFITDDLVKKSEKYGIINYCVPGHPVIGDKTVAMLSELKHKDKIDLEIVMGMSFIEPFTSLLQQDATEGLNIINAFYIDSRQININSNNLIVQVYNNIIATEVKLNLIEVYGDDYKVSVINSLDLSSQNNFLNIPLYKLDRTDGFNHETCIFLPSIIMSNRKIYDMYNLLDIMEKLRSKDGCPWDIKQTHKSLREYVIEEAYEVVEAIDNNDIDLLVEELGDLLLQVVFHCQIANEEGYFNIRDVIDGVCKKLVYRHPHVFGETKVGNISEANISWNVMKEKEKNITSYTQKLKRIPKSLSALSKSYKVQKKAAGVGFDWNDIHGALDKIKEEADELLEAQRGGDRENIEEELGDLLFAVVNVSRFLEVNPEIALNRTISKFIDRFSFIEEESSKLGKNLEEMTLEEMDDLWNMAKIHKNK